MSTRHIQRKRKHNIQKNWKKICIFTIVLKKCQSSFLLYHTKKNFFQTLFRHLSPQFSIALSHKAAVPNLLLKFHNMTPKFTPKPKLTLKFQRMLLLNGKDKSIHSFQISIYSEHNSNQNIHYFGEEQER